MGHKLLTLRAACYFDEVENRLKRRFKIGDVPYPVLDRLYNRSEQNQERFHPKRYDALLKTLSL